MDKVCAEPAARPIVMLVENFAPLRLALQRALELVHVTVISLASPEEALCYATRQPIKVHLLLSRLCVNNLSGPELAGHLRNLSPGLRVLYMADDVDAVLQEPGATEIAACLLPHPFTKETFLNRIRELLPEISARPEKIVRSYEACSSGFSWSKLMQHSEFALFSRFLRRD